MSTLSRVQVWSNRKMVTLRGELVPVPEPVLLHGVADSIAHPVCAVKLDDGRELLIAREHLEVTPTYAATQEPCADSGNASKGEP